MGIIQKLENMCNVGKVIIEGDRHEWYKVVMSDIEDGVVFSSESPTLKQAIESVDSQIKAYNTKVNIGNWDQIINRR
ncbi:MAG: hypothetical protein ACXAD7_24370 [Candidatus Kariarchaeaceae archaeon]|jgi:hypothetical protein